MKSVEAPTQELMAPLRCFSVMVRAIICVSHNAFSYSISHMCLYVCLYMCVCGPICVCIYTDCNRGFHMHCMVPEMKEIPRGLFLCSQCENVRSRTEDMKLSEYEKQRLRNIERNAKVLAGIMASAQVDTRTHTGI